VGCAKVNEGCQNCYAENLMANRYGRVVWGENGTRSKTKTWNDPIKWDRAAETAGEKRKVFCASLADVFEDFKGPILTGKNQPLWRDRRGRYDESEASGFDPYEMATLDVLRKDMFKVIDRCPNLYFLLLTKRPENILRMWPTDEDDCLRTRENVWLGTSIANQKNADEYVDRLLKSRDLSPVLFLSLEPQIGFVDLRPWLEPKPLVDWVIVGGESKQSKVARPFHMEWCEDMVDQCREAGVACFVKQMGTNVYRGKRKIQLSTPHGEDMAEWPDSIRVRECPEFYLYHVTV
jgi:protein gp37